ncbi:LuxR family transcriptional regulator [Legionella israelensis]|uniref:LuxR family transcriptional regulator n=1 Tax=Legionella israelensis TaxID=454 RepID=A0AAX1EEC1_9GAMM|nr:LuxR C-terminal-related transcriptional regulator [Legionella israelensis]QBR83443.1 LuxR family transcriptional regulator [Legionella israelensis]
MMVDKLLNETHSLTRLNHVLKDYFATFNIHSFAFTYYVRHVKTGMKLKYDWVTEPLKPWHQYYLEQGYADVDRSLEYATQRALPFFWDVQQQLKVAKNAREKRMRQESIDYGIDEGLNLTLHTPDSGLAVLVLHQRQGESGLQQHQQKKLEWLGVMHCYCCQLHRFLNQDRMSSDIQLTKREYECLRLTKEGLRLEAIAQLLNITPRTVNFHLQNANKKWGVNNKYHAILKQFSS